MTLYENDPGQFRPPPTFRDVPTPLNHTQQPTSLFASQTKPARIEIKLCAFIAENNLPISWSEDLVALVKSLFPSEVSLQNVKLGKQKATNVIRQVLGFYSIKRSHY